MKLIAETAWHHEGDYLFMRNLVTEIVSKTDADIIKMHITLDIREYMHHDHNLYESLSSMLFDKQQWQELIKIVRDNNKEIMLLLNDTKAVEFGLSLDPEYVEIHSTCLNDIFILKTLKEKMSKKTKVVLGVVTDAQYAAP